MSSVSGISLQISIRILYVENVFPIYGSLDLEESLPTICIRARGFQADFPLALSGFASRVRLGKE
ncbi:MAG: hypothetical protein II095_07510, partial [Bacteroidales bacterium]|nr:hypothetical protein [Bacteroidales bacterium]